ncbi:hypothetical protein Pfo_012470 [Paulownia fortunei]|nr:hypothetical protein Pfo_012470 [Paulownia fortunei]
MGTRRAQVVWKTGSLSKNDHKTTSKQKNNSKPGNIRKQYEEMVLHDVITYIDSELQESKPNVTLAVLHGGHVVATVTLALQHSSREDHQFTLSKVHFCIAIVLAASLTALAWRTSQLEN